MKKLTGGKDLVTAIKHFEMKDKPVDCLYVGSTLVKSEKLANEEAWFHTFARLENNEVKFGIWGYGMLNTILNGREAFGEKAAREGIVEGTALRITYLGKRPAKIKMGKKTIEKEVHNVDVFDITEEYEAGEITHTTTL